MQHLNVPVAAGRGRDDRRRAAALEAAAGDAERATAERSCPSWGRGRSFRSGTPGRRRGDSPSGAGSACRCGAFPSVVLAPRTVLPSSAITSVPASATPAMTCAFSQVPNAAASAWPSSCRRSRRNVDSDGGTSLPRRSGRAQRRKHLRRDIGRPLGNGGHRVRPGHHRRHRERQHHCRPVPHPGPCTAGRAGSPASPASSGNRAGQRDHHKPGSYRRARRIWHAGKTTRLPGQNVIFGRIHAPTGASFSCHAPTRPHGRIVTGNPSGQHCLSIRERPQPWGGCLDYFNSPARR
jgi:hypothetical protein